MIDGQAQLRHLAAAVFGQAKQDQDEIDAKYRHLAQSEARQKFISKWIEQNRAALEKSHHYEYRSRLHRETRKRVVIRRELKQAYDEKRITLDGKERNAFIEAYRKKANELRERHAEEIKPFQTYKKLPRNKIVEAAFKAYEQALIKVESERHNIEALFAKESLWSDILGFIPKAI
jgi:hypothetical protein